MVLPKTPVPNTVLSLTKRVEIYMFYNVHGPPPPTSPTEKGTRFRGCAKITITHRTPRLLSSWLPRKPLSGKLEHAAALLYFYLNFLPPLCSLPKVLFFERYFSKLFRRVGIVSASGFHALGALRGIGRKWRYSTGSAVFLLPWAGCIPPEKAALALAPPFLGRVHY